MNLDEFISDLAARGVTLLAADGRLRYFPREWVTLTDMQRLQEYKEEILERVNSGGGMRVNPFAGHRPLHSCDLCGSEETEDVPIHDGRSLRRDCHRCGRFMGWRSWYGLSE